MPALAPSPSVQAASEARDENSSFLGLAFLLAQKSANHFFCGQVMCRELDSMISKIPSSSECSVIPWWSYFGQLIHLSFLPSFLFPWHFPGKLLQAAKPVFEICAAMISGCFSTTLIPTSAC